MSIFDKLKSKKETGTELLMTKLNQTIVTNGNPLKAISRSAFSMESMSASEQAEVDGAIDSLDNDVRNVLTDSEIGDFNEEQVNASLMAGVASANDATRHDILTKTSREPVLEQGDVLVPTGFLNSGEANVGRMKEALESYDTTENKNSMMISMGYNLKAAKQDAFGEAFFPTVTVAPDVASVTISVDLLNVMEEQKRKVDGTFNHQFGRKSLINALVYPWILNNDTTLVYPVYRQGDAENTANFVQTSDVAAYDVTLENGETIKTAPLAVGREFDLLGLGSADYLVGQGHLDQTDQLDASVKLKNLYIKLATGEVVKFANLDVMPEANFTYAVQGNNRQMNLNFDTRFLKIDKNTKKVDGGDLTGRAIVTNEYAAMIKLHVFGTVNLDTATTVLNASPVTVVGLYNNSGDKVDFKQGTGKTAADEITGATVIGYDLVARRINTNRRERGQLLDLNVERLVYGMPILAPISIVRPASEAESRDSVRLDQLVSTTFVRCSNAAVETLLSARDHLANIPDDMEPELLYRNATLGAARYFVKKFYAHRSLDVKQELNTLRTGERIYDVNQVLVNTIRDLVYRGYLESNYAAALSMMEGVSDKKPKVIIGTDPYIAAYLMVTGDLRTLGDEFDVEVVSTPNVKMRNKVIIAFGRTGRGSDVANPLHFGNMFWRPELATVLQVSRNNTISRELTVQPSFLHVVHCPVMMSIDVKNLPDAVTLQVPVMVNNKVLP